MDKYSVSAFLEACQAPHGLSLDVFQAHSSSGRRVNLKQPFAVIGKHSEAQVRLPGCNRRHAYLQVLGGGVFCIDLESRSGTRWLDEQRPSGWVGAEEHLVLAEHRIQIVSPQSSVSPELNPLASDSLAAQ